jgi:ribosomal protein L11 methyltransferase
MSTHPAPLYREACPTDHQPVRIGASLLIGPRGTRRVATASDRVIELDLYPNTPATGVVFGTGEHATTRMALALLEQHVRPGDRALDVGTGSGILGLAAARLGAREVLAIDIDPLAVMNAADNIRLNRLEDTVQVREGGLEVAEGSSYDLALANILSPVIRQLAPDLWRLLRPEGLLIATGIVAVEAVDLRALLADAGFRPVEERQEGDWYAFVLQRGENTVDVPGSPRTLTAQDCPGPGVQAVC